MQRCGEMVRSPPPAVAGGRDGPRRPGAPGRVRVGGRRDGLRDDGTTGSGAPHGRRREAQARAARSCGAGGGRDGAPAPASPRPAGDGAAGDAERARRSGGARAGSRYGARSADRSAGRCAENAGRSRDAGEACAANAGHERLRQGRRRSGLERSGGGTGARRGALALPPGAAPTRAATRGHQPRERGHVGSCGVRPHHPAPACAHVRARRTEDDGCGRQGAYTERGRVTRGPTSVGRGAGARGRRRRHGDVGGASGAPPGRPARGGPTHGSREYRHPCRRAQAPQGCGASRGGGSRGD
jgi:hypothetical protein